MIEILNIIMAALLRLLAIAALLGCIAGVVSLFGGMIYVFFKRAKNATK